MYQVSDQEITTLLSSYSSIHSTLFGVAVGAAVALGITMASVDLADRAWATFVALLVVSVVGAIYFGWRWRGDHDQAKQRADDIRSR